MKRILVFALVISSLAVIIKQHSVSVSLIPDVAYAYRLVYGATNSGSYDFRFVDPANPTRIAIAESLPIPQNIAFYDFSASPNGQWLTVGSAIQIKDNPNSFVQLLNIESGQLGSTIATGTFASTLFWRGWDVSSPSVDILWSPNSQYIAFNMLDTNISPNIDIYVYSLADHKLTDLTINDREPHYRMAWSSDSTQLVTTAENCASSCSLKLEIFNVAGQSVKTIDVTNLEVQYISGASNICQLDWSPSNNYVSFISVCYPPAESSRDVYLWSLKENKVVDIYQNRANLVTTKKLWYGDNLVISAYRPNIPGHIETVLYQTTNNTVMTLASSWITDAALNPVSGVLSFRYSAMPKDAPDNSHEIFQRSPIQTGIISANKFSVAQTVAGTDSIAGNYGCDLSWSPDGVYLATSISIDCDYGTQGANAVGYAFLRNGTTPVIQRLFTTDGYAKDVAAGTTIGWTVAPYANNSTLVPANTSTITPLSITPAGGSAPGGNQIGG